MVLLETCAGMGRLESRPCLCPLAVPRLYPRFLFFWGGDNVVGFLSRVCCYLQYVVTFLGPRVGDIYDLELEYDVCSRLFSYTRKSIGASAVAV